LKNMQTGEMLAAAPPAAHEHSALGPVDVPTNTFTLTLPPHSYVALQPR
jgi:hypothetical protein